MEERRSTPRQKSFLRGCIYFNNRRSMADCLIRDISEQGARLIFSAPVNIPDEVDLYIPQKEQTLRVNVRWRHGDEMGVSFAAAAQPVEGGGAVEHGGDLADRVHRLETEIAALRRVVKRLQAAAPQSTDMDVA